MKIFVIALVVGVSAAMPQGAVDAEADIFSQPAERYGGNDETGLDQDLVDDVFNTGDSAKQIETDFVNRKCSYYEKDGYSCVPYYNCGEDNFIITDGGSLIDIRGGFSKPHDPADSGCDGYLEQCCRHPSFAGKPLITTTTPKPKPKPYVSQCGRRNSDGVGVRIQNLNNYENGKNAQFGEWPHMCAVLEKKQVGDEIVNLYVCGASLISPGVVLTAAHCVSKLQAPNVKVRCGEWDTQTTIEPVPHQDRDVKYISIHPEYNSLPPLNLWYDFALLHTDYEFELNYHVDTICLPDIDNYINSYDPKRCVATGWGKDKFGKEGIYQVVMKQVTMDIVDNQQCQNKLRATRLGEFFKLHKTFICAGGKAGEDTCKGDGGGPLVCPVDDGFGTRYVQAGIIAWGIECGLHDTPGVYANVADALCFIHNDMMCKYGNADYFGISKCDKWVERRVQRAQRKYDDFQAQQVAYQASNNGKRSRTIGSKLAYYQQVINAYDNFWNTCPGVGNSEPLIDDNTYTDSDYFDDKDEFETDLSAYVRTSPE